jgi:hypothetical protein
MDIKAFIPGMKKGLPKSYKITIVYHSGDSEEIESASHMFIPPDSKADFLEIASKDDEFHRIQMDGVRKLVFDSRWSAIVEERKKERARRKVEEEVGQES